MSTEPRRPFQDESPPEPFYQAPEFRRFLGLAGIAAMVVICFLVFTFSRTKPASEPTAANTNARAEAFVPKEKLSPEQVEARQTALLSKFEGALSDTRNGQPLNQETPGYWKMLETLVRYTPEEVEQRATREFDWKRVMDDPDAWRGEFVHARALLGPSYAYKLARPVLGRSDVYRALMTSQDVTENRKGDEDQMFMAEFVDPPDELRNEERVAVDIAGVFYRTVRYETRDVGTKEVPYVLVRNTRAVPAVAETGIRAWLAGHALLLLAGMAVLVFGAMLLFSWFQRRARQVRVQSPMSASIRDMLDKKLRAEGKVPPPPR